MSWRDRLRPASFRGVSFFVAASSTDREIFADERLFPGRDLEPESVHIEPLGAGPMRMRIDAFLVGADYDLALEELEAALLTPGPGELVHPYRGRRTVAIVGKISTQQRHRDGGFCRVRFSAVETAEAAQLTNEAPPDTDGAQAGAMAALVEATDTDAMDAAPASLRESIGSTLELGMSAARDAHTTVLRALGATHLVSSRADSLSRLVDDFVALPSDAITSVSDVLVSLYDAAADVISAPGRAADAFVAGVLAFFERFDDDEAQRPSARSDEERLRAQLADLLKGAMLAAAIRALARTSFASRSQALNLRSRMLEQTDAYLEGGIAAEGNVAGSAAFNAFCRLRAEFSRAMNESARTAPELRNYTLRAALPAIVVAHVVHADARREREILDRNPQPTPGLIDAGTTLEVVFDGP
jgi:prophage DNA circulation protein